MGLQSGKIILHNLKFDEVVMSFHQDWGPVTALAFRTGIATTTKLKVNISVSKKNKLAGVTCQILPLISVAQHDQLWLTPPD